MTKVYQVMACGDISRDSMGVFSTRELAEQRQEWCRQYQQMHGDDYMHVRIVELNVQTEDDVNTKLPESMRECLIRDYVTVQEYQLMLDRHDDYQLNVQLRRLSKLSAEHREAFIRWHTFWKENDQEWLMYDLGGGKSP